MRLRMPLQGILRPDSAVILAGLGGITALAWAYTVRASWNTSAAGMAQPAMPVALQMMPWNPLDFLLAFLMWSVMMVAMMLPSAAPMVLTFVAVNRQRRGQGSHLPTTTVFVGGYVLVWAAFALAAASAQGGLHAASLLSPMVAITNPVLGGVMLLSVGIFQWTPLKYACLKHCRTPLGFILSEWRDGTHGALAMGLRHGALCLGCCWLLMSLLFVLGVMNLLWIAALSAFVLTEKLAPAGQWIGRTAGLLLVLAGTWMLLGAALSG